MHRQDAALATKKDLRKLDQEFGTLRGEFGALSEEFGKLRREVKSELKETRRSLAVEIVKLHSRMDKIEETVGARMDEGVSKMLKLAEGFMVQSQKVGRDQTITNYRVDELEKRVKILEARA